MTRTLTVVLVAWLAVAVVPASADVIYSTYDPFVPGSGAWTGALDAIGVVESGTGQVIGGDRQVASRFVVDAQWRVTSYTAVIDIFNYDYGLNGRLSLWSGATEPTTRLEKPIDFEAPSVYPAPLSLVSIDHPLLQPGTTYWLLIQATDGWADRFSWGVSPRTTGQRLAREDGGDWAAAGTESAFEIEGTSVPVPEPATLVLVVTGLLGVCRARRRTP